MYCQYKAFPLLQRKCRNPDNPSLCGFGKSDKSMLFFTKETKKVIFAKANVIFTKMIFLRLCYLCSVNNHKYYFAILIHELPTEGLHKE